MRIYLGIHDRKSMYKHSCSLPINTLHINEVGDVSVTFNENDYEYIKGCINKLEKVVITITSRNEYYIQFNLRDYHFTNYVTE